MSLIRQILIQDPDDSTRLTHLDNLHLALITIPIEHHEVHEKQAFVVVGTNLLLGNNDTLILAFKTGNTTQRMHLVVDFSTLAGGYANILEGATWTQGSGTLETIFNRNRTAPITPSMILEDQGQPTFTASEAAILDPAILTTGTVLPPAYAFGSKNNTPSALRGQSEWVLAVNTQYAIRFTSTSANNQAQLALRPYEHTDE